MASCCIPLNWNSSAYESCEFGWEGASSTYRATFSRAPASSPMFHCRYASVLAVAAKVGCSSRAFISATSRSGEPPAPVKRAR